MIFCYFYLNLINLKYRHTVLVSSIAEIIKTKKEFNEICL